MSADLIPELLTEASAEFKKHLELEGNERILFSGKFGKGKTTLLKHFFENNQEKFDPIFIDPVHYSVASNEDIFRHIKYDIILDLLRKQVAVEGIYFSDKEVWCYYLAKHPMELIKSLVGYIPEVGKLIEPLIPAIEKLSDKIQQFKNEVNATSPEAKLLRFMESVEKDGFSIYENDMITNLIRQMIQPEGKTKKNILVIDNVDRIDPEHIFRILNVFSAHIDFRENQVSINKFYFDQVVLVCDFTNIRNIFIQRYGEGVDFSGYIDKFYSSHVFYFQNYQQLRNVAHKLIRSIKVKENDFITNMFSELNGGTQYGLVSIVAALIQMNLVSLRQVLNYCRQPLELTDVPVQMGTREVSYRANNTPAFEMFILSGLVGGYTALVPMIEELKFCETPMENYIIYFNQLFYFDLRSAHDFKNITTSIMGTLDGKQYHVTQEASSYDRVNLTLTIPPHGQPHKPAITDFYTIYLKILKEFYVSKVLE